MVPEKTLQGDVFCVAQGLQTPYALRRCGDDSVLKGKDARGRDNMEQCVHYIPANMEVNGSSELVGECYVHGIMDGEYMDKSLISVLKVVRCCAEKEKAT
jgi:hypothetical protein